MSTGKLKLIELLNRNNLELPFPITPENVSFGHPVAVAGGGWNTQITVYGTNGQGYKGQVDVFYTRVSLAALGPNLVIDSFEPFTSDSLIAALNAQKGTPFTFEDFYELFVAPQGYATDEPIQLVAHEHSYAWIGETTATLSVAIPESIIDQLHLFVHGTLPGPGPYF